MSHDTEMIRCTGKHRYATAHDLHRAMNRPGHKVRAYRCPHCQGWHVTTRTAFETARKRIRK